MLGQQGRMGKAARAKAGEHVEPLYHPGIGAHRLACRGQPVRQYAARRTPVFQNGSEPGTDIRIKRAHRRGVVCGSV